MSDMIGQRIGAYEIVSLLGKGGMAQVYRARQQLGGKVSREVALKLIDARLSMSEEFIARFEREAQTLVTLSHPHILKAFDYGQFNETVYLVMELLPGGSLAQLIKKGLLPIADVSKWLDQVGQALDYAHRQGIVHRDMKPQNVLLDNEGNAFLTDFGIVKLLGETSSLTQSNTSIGTPAYMAPEQWTSGRVDARTDLYALGVMLFEMVGGHVPFTGDTPFRVMYLHTNEPPPSIYVLRPDLPQSLDRVITKALAKDPNARYESALAMVSDFRAAMVGAAVNAPPIAVAPPANIASDAASAISGSIPNNNRTVILPASKAGLPVVGDVPPVSQAELPQQAPVAPASQSRLPLIIGLVAAAIIAVVAGGVLASLALGHNNPATPTSVVENTTAAPASTAVVAVAATTVAPTTVVPATAAATVSSIPSAVPTTSVPTTIAPTTIVPTVTPITATNTPVPTDTTVPTTTVPTAIPEPTATVLDSALVLQTALAQALTQTATQRTPTATLTFTPSETPTITPSETPSPTPTETVDVMATAVRFAILTNTAVFQIAALNTQNALPNNTYTPSPLPSATVTVTPSLTPTLSLTVTLTASNTTTPRPSATLTNTVAPTNTKTLVPTRTDTPVPTRTLTPTDTPVPTDTLVPTNTNTPRPTITPVPSKTNTSAPTVPPTHVPLDVIASTATARAASGAPATDTPFYNSDPLLPNNMNVTFSDQFYNNDSNWPLYSKANVGSVQIANNQLQFALKPNAYMEVIAPTSAPSVTDFYFRTYVTYTAPSTWATTSFGVIIHRSAVGYDFIDIRPGTCIFALNTFTVKTNAYVNLNIKNACQTGSQLNKLTSFVLTVVGSSNQFTVYIDNVKEAVLADTAKVYTSGQMGLYASSSQANGFNVQYADIAIAQ